MMIRNQRGAAIGPILAFLGILFVGLLIALFIFYPKFKESQMTEGATVEPNALTASGNGGDSATGGTGVGEAAPNGQSSEGTNVGTTNLAGGSTDGSGTQSPDSATGSNNNTGTETPATTGSATPGSTGTPGMANALVVTPDGSPAAGTASNPDSTASGPTKVSPYATDTAMVGDLSKSLQSGNIGKFVEIAGDHSVTAVNKLRLQNLFVKRKFTVSANSPLIPLADATAGVKNWGVNLAPPTSSLHLGEQQIQLGLAKDPTFGWGISKLVVPDIEAIAAATQPSNPADIDPTNALAVAKDFFTALVGKNFQRARKYVNPAKLTDEKLAALFIVVEEGEFKPHDKNPLIPTATLEKSAWFVARLKSMSKESDFGLEMSRAANSEPWKIISLNFSKLIQSSAAELGAGDIAYSPIKTNLKGGDSLVIYFEYDDKGVNARASKQLNIIASILKQDPTRQLHINGHADARGDDTYNDSLSQSRATGVHAALLALGVPEGQLVSQGFGESAPKAPNLNPDGTDNPSGRAQNRRAEVYLAF